MSKAIVNNRINSSNIYGRTIQHDIYLNQGVRSEDSPVFNNLLLTGNATINGNLYVEGNTSLLDTNTVQFKDNIILINDKETGVGVTLNQSGLEIDRGVLENFRIIYNESDKRVEMGVKSNLQAVCLRESIPLNNGIMTWNSISNLITSTNKINIPLSFTDTTNSTSSSTGSISVLGGLGIKDDMFIDGNININGNISCNNSSGNFNINSILDINLLPNKNVFIPYNKSIAFGSVTQSMLSDTNGNLNMNANGDINLIPKSGKKISIPNQIPLVFSSTNEKIYTDNSNNMIVAGSQDIYLSPGNGIGNSKKILVPVNTPLAFSNINQSIISNINNDLIVNANNNIFLNPGSLLDVKIPNNCGLKLGVNRISSNSNNELNIVSTGDLFLSPKLNINIPSNVLLTFSSTNQNISGDTNGNIILSTINKINSTSILYNSNTTNSTCATDGSIYILGGLGVTKDIFCESTVNIISKNSFAFKVNKQFYINSLNSGKVNILTGDGSSLNPSLEIISNNIMNSQSLIQLKTLSDLTIGYNIGRNDRKLTINLPSYIDYSNLGEIPKFSIMSNNNTIELFSVESDTGNIASLGALQLSNTQDSSSPSTGSVVILGGLGILGSIYTNGRYISSINSTNAFEIKDTNNNILFNIDSINNQVTINQNVNIKCKVFNLNSSVSIDTTNLSTNLNVINTNPTQSNDTSSGSNILSGGMAIQSNLNVGGQSSFNSVNMTNTNIFNLKDPILSQDAATKAYVDLVKQGLFVKDSVNVATISPLNLNSDFVSNNIIDNYTLNFGDRILIKNQTNSVENGIYSITNSVPIRTLDLQNGYKASGIFVFVKSGIINSSLGWICNSQSSNDIVNTNSINFTEFTGLGQVQPGLSLSKNFNQINVNTDNISIETELISNTLRIKNTVCSTGLTGGSGFPLQTTTDQSHVTKIGIVNSGTWQANTIQVSYGGTGKNTFNTGNILFGNGLNPINTNNNLYYDNANIRLGLGTNNPTKDIEVKSVNTVTLLLNSDSDGNNSLAKPEILLSYFGGQNKSYLGMTRTNNEYGFGIYSDALVLSNNQLNNSSIIQLATSQISRLTILSNGFIGINTSTPNSTLNINGTLLVSDVANFSSVVNSINSSTASVIVSGGISINCSANSVSVKNGGSLTINGGTSINKDLYVGGSITSILGFNTFNYIKITATDISLNLSTGSLITIGGISIQCSADAVNVSNGGGLSVAGGVSINKSVYIGGTLNTQSDTYLNNLYFLSTANRNYIQSSNTLRTNGSFTPISFTQYNNTLGNILTIANNGIIINNSNSIQIGGTLENPDGYTCYYTTGNLNVLPNNTNYNINFGTIGNYTNFNIYGTNNNSKLSWQSVNSKLILTNASLQLSNQLNSIVLTTPNTSGNSFIQASGGNMTINLGMGSIGGQLTTILSNNIGNSNIIFTPSNITNSSLIINNVISTFNSVITTNDRVEYSGNALHQNLINNSSNQQWIYFGIITGYTEIDFNNGASNSFNIGGLHLSVNINSSGVFTATHSHYGNISFSSNLKPICYIYNDSLNYQLFVRLASNSSTNINVTFSSNKLLLLDENTGSVPSGIYSKYSNSWSQVYSTQLESTLKYTTGDLTVEGSNLNASDNLPIIGYNNIHTTNSRDLGILYQRYQNDNDIGTGDIVNDKITFIDSIVNQSLVSNLSQIKFSNLTSLIDNYYNGYWIKIASGICINQTRKIISYNGAQHIATLDSPFTIQNPSSGDTVYFYNDTFIVNYYDEVNNTFALAYTSSKTTNIVSNGDANLRLKSLYSTDTTISTNSSSGSLTLLGGISINNTNNAISSTFGGTITTLGGISLAKTLIVGNNIGVGTSGFTPKESIHIRNNTCTERFEHNQGSYSYIDFMENASNNRYGILVDSSVNQFSLTNTNSGVNPLNSNKALTINNLGYIGINTTSNIISPLSINTNNFISTNSSSGFLGIIGGASNTNDNTISSRIILNSNFNSGSLNLYTGNNTIGSVSIFTGNDTEQFKINSSGVIKMKSTQVSDSSTTGALVISGGVSIGTTQNASSYTSGGALSIAGGASISKDLYIGGNILINGNFTATGNIKTPSINFISFTNCSLIEYFNVNLILSGNAGVLTFGFSVNPTKSSLDTEIQFVLPNRTNSLIRRLEVISSISGYTDDTLVVPLFNILATGIVNTTNMLIKFQSVSTSAHYIQIQSTYIVS